MIKVRQIFTPLLLWRFKSCRCHSYDKTTEILRRI